MSLLARWQLLPVALAAALALPSWWVISGQRSEIWALPVVLGLGLAMRRRPSILVVALFAVVSVSGTITAFTDYRPAQVANVLLGALWIGAAITWLQAEQRRKIWLWPGLLAILGYLAITLIAVLLTEPVSLGVESFRQQGWYLSAAVLVGLAPWSGIERERIVKGIVVVGTLAGTYIAYGLVVGFSGQEAAQARDALVGLPSAEDPRFYGTFETANALALWAATLFPFALAIAVEYRGQWRGVAFAASALTGLAAIASDVRIALLALIASIALVLGLRILAPSTRPSARPKLVAAAVAAPALAALALAIVVTGNPAAGDRLASGLDPSNDISYVKRARSWEDAVQRIDHGPVMGYGLGTQGTVALSDRRLGPVGSASLDSSYLKVAIEQGLPVSLLLFGGLALLAAALARAGLLLWDSFAAAIAIAGAATVVTLLILFTASTYVEGLTILPAWILVGLGIAAVTERGSDRRASAGEDRDHALGAGAE